jgi:hypothetical protein
MRVDSRHEAPSITALALACSSRPDRLSTKWAPFTLPVALSTVSSRTTALVTSVSLPVAFAFGSSRLAELASWPSPSARRILVSVIPCFLPAAANFTAAPGSGDVSSRNCPSGSDATPALRPETRKIGSTRS